MKREETKNQPIQFLGYEIMETNDGIFMKGQKSTGLSYDSHLGYYSTFNGAKRAAILYFMLARPEVFAPCIASILSFGDRDGYGFERFRSAVEKAGLDMPEEITSIWIALRQSAKIAFNGQLFNGFLDKDADPSREDIIMVAFAPTLKGNILETPILIPEKDEAEYRGRNPKMHEVGRFMVSRSVDLEEKERQVMREWIKADPAKPSRQEQKAAAEFSSDMERLAMIERIKSEPEPEPDRYADPNDLPEELEQRLWEKIRNAAKTCGSFNPEKNIPYYMEELTASEYKLIDSFLDFITTYGYTMGDGNYQQRYQEWRLAYQEAFG